MKRLIALVIALAGPVAADPATQARDALARLEAAMEALEAAEGARDRVAALTETVRGFEAGLAAMREGLRAVSIREAQLARRLEAREAGVAQLLGVLQSIGTAPAPVLFLHPGGPLGTARAGMLVAEVTPALEAEAGALRRDLQEVVTLRALQEAAAEQLTEGLAGVQAARAELSAAIADRTDLPRRFIADPVGTQILIAATETLEGFASGLSEIGAAAPDAPPLPGIADRKGELPLPVEGTILRRAGEADAAGIERPGIVVATRPRALVSTPATATLRYRGPLLDYGQVSILEPEDGMLIVLAGLETVFGEAGQVLPEGSPVGLMGGAAAGADAFLSRNGEGGGSDRSETLYIEIRKDTTPVDPLDWFRAD
ncbi:peptidase M23 [Rhodosalinus halophilus]|uniref:Peptidase M23 n=1 Tax=Rhodosalinus halophilus TaxID=2259333 RepID=A0A365U9Y2_9RHOB|nr:peptidoglycan DD-metalloendopeptidase family protein [Rhodosalinus halophilus]RBI85830.1 peptidase M23 [Rhodosalinus halophilus]